jgi:hypothetical protein
VHQSRQPVQATLVMCHEAQRQQIRPAKGVESERTTLKRL